MDRRFSMRFLSMTDAFNIHGAPCVLLSESWILKSKIRNLPSSFVNKCKKLGEGKICFS